MKEPNWNNLITGNCPKCEYKMGYDGGLLDDATVVQCVQTGCGFKIRTTRMNEIINNLVGRKKHGRATFEENMEALNLLPNKGHKNI